MARISEQLEKGENETSYFIIGLFHREWRLQKFGSFPVKELCVVICFENEFGDDKFRIEVDLIAISSSKLKERRVSGSIFSFFDFLDFFPHLFFSCLFPTDLTAVFFSFLML